MMLGKVNSWALVRAAVVLLWTASPASGTSLPPRLAALSPPTSVKASAPEPVLAEPVERSPPATAATAASSAASAVATATTKGEAASNEQEDVNGPTESDADSPPAAPSLPQGCTFFLVRREWSAPGSYRAQGYACGYVRCW